MINKMGNQVNIKTAAFITVESSKINHNFSGDSLQIYSQWILLNSD
jgi:hypothetical protein